MFISDSTMGDIHKLKEFVPLRLSERPAQVTGIQKSLLNDG